MSRQFVITILTILVIGIGTLIGVMLAKGYRFSPKTGTVAGTGIISVTSVPDQASVYLDDHLTTATNANINSLTPKTYNVRIVKEGFIPWEKKVDVKEGLVTNIKASLFRSIPSIYPLTYNGAQSATLSPDGQKLLFVIPGTDKKGGVWIWNMSNQAIGFSRGGEPHQIAANLGGYDYTKATFQFSPDTKQVLVTLPDRSLLLDDDRLNDQPRDITAVLSSTVNAWKEETNSKNLARLETIRDINLRKIASDSATVKWSPDETKFFVSDKPKQEIKVYDLAGGDNFTLPFVDRASWLPDSNHLVFVEASGSADQKTGEQQPVLGVQPGKISVLETDGSNKYEIYVGNFDPASVVAWPDSSRLVLISSFPTATAKQPNLYGINLK